MQYRPTKVMEIESEEGCIGTMIAKEWQRCSCRWRILTVYSFKYKIGEKAKYIVANTKANII